MENLNTQGRYKRGQIYFVKSTHKEVGTEQWADRPAVIVSNDENNKCSTAVEVCYMTTRPKTDLPTHFITNQALRPSTVICEQVTTVYNERIGEWIGELSPEEMQRLDKCLEISLGLEKTKPKETPEIKSRAEFEKVQRERDLYKDLYERLNKELLNG